MEEAYTNEFGEDKVVIDPYIENHVLAQLADELGASVDDIDYKTVSGLDQELQGILGTIADDINNEDAEAAGDLAGFGNAPGAGRRSQPKQRRRSNRSLSDTQDENASRSLDENSNEDSTTQNIEPANNTSGATEGAPSSESSENTDSYDPYPDADVSDPGDTPENSDRGEQENTAEQQPQQKSPSTDQNQNSDAPQTDARANDTQRQRQLRSEQQQSRRQKKQAEQEKPPKELEELREAVEKAKKTPWAVLIVGAICVDLLELALAAATGLLAQLANWAITLIVIPSTYLYLYTRGKIVKEAAKEARKGALLAGIVESFPVLGLLPAKTVIMVVLSLDVFKKIIEAKKKIASLEKKYRKKQRRSARRNK